MGSKDVLMHVLPAFLQPSHSNHILAYNGESRVGFTFIFLRTAALECPAKAREGENDHDGSPGAGGERHLRGTLILISHHLSAKWHVPQTVATLCFGFFLMHESGQSLEGVI